MTEETRDAADGPAQCEIRYGLRFFEKGSEVKVAQIGGGGRVRLNAGGREWWSRAPFERLEVFETDNGQTYATAEEAAEVCVRLTRG